MVVLEEEVDSSVRVLDISTLVEIVHVNVLLTLVVVPSGFG